MGSHLWALSSPTFISLPATSLGRIKLQVHRPSPCSNPHLPAPVPSLPWPRSFAASQKSRKNDHGKALPLKSWVISLGEPGITSTTNGGSPWGPSYTSQWDTALFLLEVCLSEAHLLQSILHSGARTMHQQGHRNLSILREILLPVPTSAKHPHQDTEHPQSCQWLSWLPFPAKLQGK